VVFARAPASSANLGPGFDALALALDLYVSVDIRPAARLSVEATGEGKELPRGAAHLAAVVATRVTGHDRLAIRVHSDIPVGRGLGSSAALAVAAAAAAGAVDPLAEGHRVDGHPENAAASTLGGLVAASVIDGVPTARRLPLDPRLRAVLIIPDRSLPTAEARAALPAQVYHRDAAFNLGRLALLVAGLADETQLIPEAFADRLHQDARAVLFPEAEALLEGLREAGALGVCWSGAGPSLLAMTTMEDAPALAEAATMLLDKHGVAGTVRAVAPDVEGVRRCEEAPE
jgi:homoserine kinase